MAKYIDTNYLFKCPTCRHFDGDECDTFCDSYECYSPDMSKIPTADVVEVVRCKDCEYFGKDMGYGKHDCKKYEMPYCLETDFCSYGKRKEGAE